MTWLGLFSLYLQYHVENSDDRDNRVIYSAIQIYGCFIYISSTTISHAKLEMITNISKFLGQKKKIFTMRTHTKQL